MRELYHWKAMIKGCKIGVINIHQILSSCFSNQNPLLWDKIPKTKNYFGKGLLLFITLYYHLGQYSWIIKLQCKMH